MAKKKSIKSTSRRTFLRNITLSALAAGGLAAYLLHTKPWHTPYQRWYDENLRFKGQEFIHSEFRKERTPTENDKAYFNNEFRKHSHHFKNIHSVNYFKGNKFTEFPGDESAFKEFERRTRKATQQFFSYCGIEREI